MLRPLGLQPATLQALLIVAGVACFVAMSMPQVHIVAYCSDLGIGPARGAQMLSLMLGMGIVSRLASGWIADRIGGLRTLLLGSLLQGVALLMFLFADGVAWLFLVSALFGLFQGGIVPSYPLVVREYFSPAEAGARVGTVLMATLFGMALGGWMSGALFDWTGSYRAAFINGIAEPGHRRVPAAAWPPPGAALGPRQRGLKVATRAALKPAVAPRPPPWPRAAPPPVIGYAAGHAV